MESPCVRKKENICATLSPHLVKKIRKLVDQDDEFSSVSDLVSVAVTEFLVKFP